MRTAPAVTVDVAAANWALAALTGVAIAAVTVSAVWASMRHDLVGWGVWGVVVTVAASTLYRAWARPVLRLRWDGQCWWLGPASAVAEPVPGDAVVALDLGAWMLMRFRATSPQARPRHRWMPLQKSGLPTGWHALRCAAYSPRPRDAAMAESDVRA